MDLSKIHAVMSTGAVVVTASMICSAIAVLRRCSAYVATAYSMFQFDAISALTASCTAEPSTALCAVASKGTVLGCAVVSS